MKKKLISAVLCAAMVTAMCGINTYAKDEKKTISILWEGDGATDGAEAACKAAEEALGIKIDFEHIGGGEEGDNIVKTRLASGDMADLLCYNCGSLLAALNPEAYFADLSNEEFADKLDSSFSEAASVDGVLYGIPAESYSAGAVLYNKEKYEEYGLEVPKTWDQFLKNCEVLKEAGETAVIGTYSDAWTCQIPFLGDHYNLLAAEPDFPAEFEAGKAKYATTPAGVKSFQKIADLTQYLNSDYMATSYDDGCDMMMEGDGVHWFTLTSALGNMYTLYGDDVNNIGCFGVPGDDADNAGLTVWAPNAIYANKNSENMDTVLEFMNWYLSEEGLNAYAQAQKPCGPFAVKDAELPEDSYQAVKDMQKDYIETGLTGMAMEFQTAVKGSNAASICQELGSGQTTAEEAAQKYDDDCKKQAVQLGLDW